MTLVDLARRAPVGPPLHAHRGAVRAVALSRDGRLLATADANSVVVWDLATRRPARPPIQAFTDILALAISPDGRTLAIGDDLGWVTLRELAGASAKPLVLQATEASNFQFSPDGTILAVARYAGEVWLWRVTDHSLLHRLPADRSQATALAFTSDGRTLATGGLEGKVRLWDTRTGGQLGPPLAGHGSPVGAATFSPDGRVLATVDGEAVLWDVASRKQIGIALPARTRGRTPWRSCTGEASSRRPPRAARCWCGASTPPPGGRAPARSSAAPLTRQEWQELLPGRPYQDVCPARPSQG